MIWDPHFTYPLVYGIMLLLAYLDCLDPKLLHLPLVAAVVGLGLVMGEVSHALYFVGAIGHCA